MDSKQIVLRENWKFCLEEQEELHTSKIRKYYVNKNQPRNFTSDTNMQEVYSIDSYAVRFKGSSQYAAYKYEVLCEGGDLSKVYASVKIKALPQNADISVYDICRNDEYWNKDYIEFKFPYIGTIMGGQYCDCFDSSVLSSSAVAVGTNKGKGVTAGFRYQTISNSVLTVRCPLRLVKVSSANNN